MDAKAAAYFAGIIDGEGTICIMKHRPKLASGEKSVGYLAYLKVCNTDYRLVAWCRETTGVGCIYSEKRKKPNCRQVYTWHISSARFYALLKEVYPYLVIKKEQADLIFLFAETYRMKWRHAQGTPAPILATRERCFEQMKHLHRYVEHGPPIRRKDLQPELVF